MLCWCLEFWQRNYAFQSLFCRCYNCFWRPCHALHSDHHDQPGHRLPKLVSNLFLTKFEPGINTSPELDPDLASYFQSLIGVICWIIKLGCIDIAIEASLLLSISTQGNICCLAHRGLPMFAPQLTTLYGSNLSTHWQWQFPAMDWKHFMAILKNPFHQSTKSVQ